MQCFCDLNFNYTNYIFLLAFFAFYDKIFFEYGGSFVWNCESKDMFDIAKLNSIIEDNISFNSIQELSSESGITINNLNRYIKNNKIDYKF